MKTKQCFDRCRRICLVSIADYTREQNTVKKIIYLGYVYLHNHAQNE
jgi:hypothetical protein